MVKVYKDYKYNLKLQYTYKVAFNLTSFNSAIFFSKSINVFVIISVQ